MGPVFGNFSLLISLLDWFCSKFSLCIPCDSSSFRFFYGKRSPLVTGHSPFSERSVGTLSPSQ